MKFIADIHISPQTVESLAERGYIINRVNEFISFNAKDEEYRKLYCLKLNPNLIEEVL
jgi:hypothetical protein